MDDTAVLLWVHRVTRIPEGLGVYHAGFSGLATLPVRVSLRRLRQWASGGERARRPASRT